MTCSAEGYQFLSSNTLDKNVQEIFQIPTVRSDRTRALFNSLHGGGPIRGFVGGLRCGVSTPSVPLRRSETDACGRTCLASFRHSVTKKCHSAAKLLADSASGLLVSHPLRWPGILQQMIDIASDLFHLGQQLGAGFLLQFQ